jgi:alanyl-tRNA synthetase
VSEKAAQTVKRLKEIEAGAVRVKEAMAAGDIGQLLDRAVDIGYKVVVSGSDPMLPTGMRSLWDVLRTRGANAIVLVVADAESGKPIVLAAGDDVAIGAGFNAGVLVKQMSEILGGRGGGKPGMAQGGGENVGAIDEALRVARDTLGIG